MFSINFPISGRRDRREWQVHVVQSLGMADEDVAIWHEVARQLLQNLLLRGPVKVNDDVSAEDYVRPFREAKIRIHEIDAPEFHELPQFRNHAHSIGGRIPTTQEVLSAQF